MFGPQARAAIRTKGSSSDLKMKNILEDNNFMFENVKCFIDKDFPTATHSNQNYVHVVYFDQRLGAAQSKCWFHIFRKKNVKRNKEKEKLDKYEKTYFGDMHPNAG